MFQIHPDKNVHFLSVGLSFYHVLGERAIISGRNWNAEVPAMERDFGAGKPASCVSHSAARAAIMQLPRR